MADVTVIDAGGIIAAHRKWFTFLGIALVIAGVLSIIFPFAGGLAVEVWNAKRFATVAFDQSAWKSFASPVTVMPSWAPESMNDVRRVMPSVRCAASSPAAARAVRRATDAAYRQRTTTRPC